MRNVILAASALFFVATTVTAAIPADQRQALVALYVATDGPEWFSKDHWLEPEGTECGWYGIVCDGTESNVLYVGLFQNNLKGPIPQEIAQLRNLRGLWISDNHLTGSLPASIGGLQHLQYLNVYNNELQGNVPAEFNGLTNLVFLILGANSLRLSGSFSFPHLQSLNLDSFALTSVPSWILAEKGLSLLSMVNNSLKGSAPAELAALSNLQHLYLGGNQLDDVPLVYAELRHLRTLFLYDNKFDHIPPVVYSLAELRNLNFSFNPFKQFPYDLVNNGALSKLTQLFLAGDGFSGGVPYFGTLRNLQTLDLGYNSFDGFIDVGFDQLQKLESLDLSNNRFDQPVPDALGLSTQLTYVNLSHNQLPGTLPDALGSLTLLQTLDVGYNHLSGPIPAVISQWPNISQLTLRSNRFEGTIPDIFGRLSSLAGVDLSENDLHGEVPASLASNGPPWNVDVGYNAVYTTNDDRRRSLLIKGPEADWQATETTAPQNLTDTDATATTISLSWDPIAYMEHSGGYQILLSRNQSGPFDMVSNIVGKNVTTATIANLDPQTTYYIEIESYTDHHGTQQNKVVSDPSPPVSAHTQ